MGLLQEARRIWGHSRSEQVQDPTLAIAELEKEFSGIQAVNLKRFAVSGNRHTNGEKHPSYEVVTGAIRLFDTDAYKDPGRPLSASLVIGFQLFRLACSGDEVEHNHPMALISSDILDKQDLVGGKLFIRLDSKPESYRWVFNLSGKI